MARVINKWTLPKLKYQEIHSSSQSLSKIYQDVQNAYGIDSFLLEAKEYIFDNAVYKFKRPLIFLSEDKIIRLETQLATSDDESFRLLLGRELKTNTSVLIKQEFSGYEKGLTNEAAQFTVKSSQNDHMLSVSQPLNHPISLENYLYQVSKYSHDPMEIERAFSIFTNMAELFYQLNQCGILLDNFDPQRKDFDYTSISIDPLSFNVQLGSNKISHSSPDQAQSLSLFFIIKSLQKFCKFFSGNEFFIKKRPDFQPEAISFTNHRHQLFLKYLEDLKTQLKEWHKKRSSDLQKNQNTTQLPQSQPQEKFFHQEESIKNIGIMDIRDLMNVSKNHQNSFILNACKTMDSIYIDITSLSGNKAELAEKIITQTETELKKIGCSNINWIKTDTLIDKDTSKKASDILRKNLETAEEISFNQLINETSKTSKITVSDVNQALTEEPPVLENYPCFANLGAITQFIDEKQPAINPEADSNNKNLFVPCYFIITNKKVSDQESKLAHSYGCGIIDARKKNNVEQQIAHHYQNIKVHERTLGNCLYNLRIYIEHFEARINNIENGIKTYRTEEQKNNAITLYKTKIKLTNDVRSEILSLLDKDRLTYSSLSSNLNLYKKNLQHADQSSLHKKIYSLLFKTAVARAVDDLEKNIKSDQKNHFSSFVINLP